MKRTYFFLFTPQWGRGGGGVGVGDTMVDDKTFIGFGDLSNIKIYSVSLIISDSAEAASSDIT